MNRRLFLRVTIPSLAIGLFFFAVCLMSIRYIHRLQVNLSEILATDIASLQAAQELEIQVRQLRFHNLLYLLDPKTERLKPIEDDEAGFEAALEVAREASDTDEERELVRLIDEGYREYKEEQDLLRAACQGKTLPDAYKASDSHPVRRVVDPCHELFRINRDKMQETADTSQRVSREGYVALLILGLAGAAGGLIVGYGITRGLRHSIYRLSVRVQDIAQHLDRDVGSVSVVADGDLNSLEEQMKFIVQKVEQAAKQLQQQQRELLRTEQLSLVGQLAAGVAHEIRNPLTGIKMLVEAALKPQSPRALNAEDLQIIVREIKRLEQTVQGFLNFARLPPPQTAPCDLRGLVRQALDLVQVRITQQRVNPSLRLPSDPVVVAVDAGQLTTVLVNLLVNALDVMGKGGELGIFLDPPEDGFVRLSVCDTGPGIPPEIQEKLFQPFATNKPHGTGLGLYLSGRILEEHGGSITARNRIEGGSCFTVTLPTNPTGGAP